MTPQPLPTIAAIYATVDATWPPAAFHNAGPWTLREGQGGGQRVSAATAIGPVTDADIAQAEAAMAALGQNPLFMIRDGDEALDAALAARGYAIKDPVVAYVGRCADIADPAPPGMAAFAIWPPLQIMADIWAEAGIGPARLAVMHRAGGAKTGVLGRQNDRPSGVAFVAIHEKMAMLHALEVIPAQRRQGSANNILRRSANWAQDQGAMWFSLVVTTANAPARNLYASLGMQAVGNYHYRVK